LAKAISVKTRFWIIAIKHLPNSKHNNDPLHKLKKFSPISKKNKGGRNRNKKEKT
jgi:hypothetical protein